jgi:hypothetical protein
MKTSEKLDQLIPALLKAQLELPKVMKKDATGRFEYTSLDNLLIIVKPILAKHGLLILQNPSGSETMIGVETTLYHSSGQFITSKMETEIEKGQGRNLYQNAGTGITYYRRYSIMSFLNLASGEDTDGEIKDFKPKSNNKTHQKPSIDQQKQDINSTIGLQETKPSSNGINFDSFDDTFGGSQ